MSDPAIEEKMLRLLPHWAEHLDSHADEFVQWSAAGTIDPDLQEVLKEAESAMRTASAALAAATERLAEKARQSKTEDI